MFNFLFLKFRIIKFKLKENEKYYYKFFTFLKKSKNFLTFFTLQNFINLSIFLKNKNYKIKNIIIINP